MKNKPTKMKKIVLLILLSIVIVSCKNDAKKETNQKEVTETKNQNFPEELGKVFETHGGINAWRKARILSFNLKEEVHTTDLYSRKIVVNHPDYSLGFNGETTWLKEVKEGSFKSNIDFYYNLFFYFYAMPFVLADDGITYTNVPDLEFEGIKFPGYKISYASDKGTSPDDNYIIYYNPKTFQMEWLAYTVTFNSKQPSEKYNLIRYNSWENSTGLVLPKEITWYKKDDSGNPIEPARPATQFTLPLVSKSPLAESFFEKPVK